MKKYHYKMTINANSQAQADKKAIGITMIAPDTEIFPDLKETARPQEDEFILTDREKDMIRLTRTLEKTFSMLGMNG
jgi:hypothetical protein